MKNRLLIATNNKHKVEEIKSILSILQVELFSLEDLQLEIIVEEDAATLEGNALKKAREVFRATNFPSLADDTGLEVFALHGEPGVYSARYAGEKATYKENCDKLLSAMNYFTGEERKARFRCVIAFVAPNVETMIEGVCSGTIITSPRGASGFGYDPIFIPDGFTKTFAELSPSEKNTISHRGNALAKMKTVLQGYFV